MIADLVQDTTTTTGTGNISLSGSPAAGFQALSVLGGVGKTFGYKVSAGSEWEIGEGTMTAANTFSRSPTASSNGGALVNFSAGTKTFQHVVTAAQFNQFQSVRQIPFAPSIPLSAPGVSILAATTLSGNLTLSIAASPVVGAQAWLPIIGDGSSSLTITGAKKLNLSGDFDNRLGIENQLQFFYDGRYVWYSISQELNATATASSLAMSLSSASTAVGAPITVTVGTNSPLTGSQTESVALTAPVAGTWSANPVTLNSGAQNAAPTFTPSASGSGNITASATGTPALAGASQALTVSAAATVPAAPTIGTAVAGDGYIDVPFTRNGNGGSAVIDSTATLSTGETATGTTSPIRVTATNGTARTATVKDRNSVGQSAASAASNSVTPASAALRLTNLVLMTETGSSPNFGYAGAGGDYGASGIGGLTNKVRAANALSSFEFTTVAIKAPNAGEPMLGIVPAAATAPVPFGDMSLCVYAAHLSGTPKYTVFGNGSALTTVNSVTPTEEGGDKVRFTWATTTTIKVEIALAAAPSTDIEVGTYSAPATAQRFQVTASKASLIGNLTGTNLT